MSDEVEQPAEELPKLSRRHKQFCDHYLTGMTGAAAARAVGCKGDANHQANWAYRTLKRPEVQAYLAEQRAKAESVAGIRKELVLRRLYLTASSEVDVRQLFAADGSPLPVHDIPDDVAKTLCSIKVDEIWDGQGDSRKFVGLTKEFKQADPNRAAEVLAKICGWIRDKVEIDTNAPAPVIQIMPYEDADEAERAARAAISRNPSAT